MPTTRSQYRILHLEDDPNDAALVEAVLQSEGLSVIINCVDNEAEFRQALSENHYDLVLSDHNIIGFNGSEALAICRQYKIKVPFILFSGEINDEKAIEFIKRGATDYLLKDNISKLVSIVKRAINEAVVKVAHEEQQLIQNEILKVSKAAFFKLDHDGKLIFINNFFSKMLAKPEEDILGKAFTSFLVGQECEQVAAYIKQGVGELTVESRLVEQTDHALQWVHIHMCHQVDDTEETAYCIGSMMDISHLKQAEQKLENNIVELRLIHEGTAVVANAASFENALFNCVELICNVMQWPLGHVYVPDENNQQLISSGIWYLEDQALAQNFVRITKKVPFKRGEGLPGRVWNSRKPEWITDVHQHAGFIRAKLCDEIEVFAAVGFPVIVDDEVIAILEFFSLKEEREDENIMRIFNTLGEQVGHVFERKRIENKLEQLAHYDTVTGLSNRAMLHEVLRLMLDKSKLNKRDFAVLFMDIDNFKYINDSFGHVVGDKLLKSIAQRINMLAREGDYLARLSGDEFVMIVDDIANADMAADTAARLIQLVRDPVYIEKREINISMSIGVAIYPYAGTNEESLLTNADAAMYQAKLTGKNNFQFYTQELNERNSRRLALASNLLHAIRNNEFYLVYQPQIDMQQQRIYGIEALIRWQSPVLGLVPPEEFIPIAESIGAIHEIGSWVIDEAFSSFNQLLSEFPDSALLLNINCSTSQLQRMDFIKAIENSMYQHRIDCHHVILEATETVLMQHIEQTRHQLEQLHDIGVQFAIDDFGTGYSSLSYIKQLPISILKIDKSFVSDLPHDLNDVAIVAAIMGLAKELGLKVVAEGVETQAQADFLTQLECHYAQGFLYARPMKYEDLLQYLREAK